MIDLNHILLFIACVSPLVMLGQTLRRGKPFRSWRMASLAVLIVTGGAWLIDANTAGFVGGGAWLALLLVPAVGIRKISELTSRQQHAWARRLAVPLRFLHPTMALRDQAQLLRGLELAQAGDFSGALALLASLRNNGTNVGRQATAQSFRLRGEWTNLAGWVRSEVPVSVRRNDFGLIPLYLRALGETGAREEMLMEFAGVLTAGSTVSQPAWSYQASLGIVLAFCGRLQIRADRRPLRKFPRQLREFWIATDELAAGRSVEARARLMTLRTESQDNLLLSEIEQRLSGAETITNFPLPAPALGLLKRIEQTDQPVPTAFGSDVLRPTIVVSILIALNVAMFLAEVRLGGSTNPLTLHRLGALEPWAVRHGQYWRMVTALFLHFGPLHLIFNLYALFVIGPGLERLIGSIRFAIYYFLSGLGSSAGVLLLRLHDFSRPEQMVGASGCVMGIVGVWAGYLLRHRREPFAGKRLANIALIVAIQTAFDLSTPQISMTAHLSGLGTGFLLGLLLPPRPVAK
jgi:rhomboid protease GluP